MEKQDTDLSNSFDYFLLALYVWLVLEKNKLILYPSFSINLFQYISGGACTQEHMAAHVQIDLGEGKVVLTNRFYLPHANCVKQALFLQESIIL